MKDTHTQARLKELQFQSTKNITQLQLKVASLLHTKSVGFIKLSRMGKKDDEDENNSSEDEQERGNFEEGQFEILD